MPWADPPISAAMRPMVASTVARVALPVARCALTAAEMPQSSLVCSGALQTDSASRDPASCEVVVLSHVVVIAFSPLRDSALYFDRVGCGCGCVVVHVAMHNPLANIGN